MASVWRGSETLAVLMKVPYEAMVDKKRPSRQGYDPRIAAARKSLLHWHRCNGRHDLPWRILQSPYAVLVSEFMLQQTTVTTVIPRFHEWMSCFPTVDALAVAREQDVLSAWEGLGYYSRARRLHAAARTIVDKHRGDVPEAESDLLALPGVGVYTAAAIRAFAHDHSAVVLDTNIIRVLARWFDLRQPIDTAEGRKALALLAGDFFPRSGCRDTASALMDLGAMVCKAGVPSCNACPLQKTCLADDPSKIPSKAPRPVTTKRIEHRGWFLKKGLLYMEQSDGPLWPGLWILPKLGNTRPGGRALVTITYPITRYRVTMRVFPAHGKIPQGLRGFSLKEVAGLPVPSPHRRAIAAASLTGHSDT